jgi:hypothetical protein
MENMNTGSAEEEDGRDKKGQETKKEEDRAKK